MATKKEPTAKQLAAREKFGQAAKERAAKARAEKENKTEPVQANTDNADIGELIARIKELELAQARNTLQTPQISDRGSLVGTFERYNTSKGFYPDPRDRLSQEQRLQRFAFSDNYELEFVVEVTAYQTLDNRNVKEPKFTLKLIQVVYDDDTGEVTNKRFVRTQMIFHEDPDTALSIAQDVGFDVASLGEKDFLDEMRYLRMRDWLLECFYPAPLAKPDDRKEVVMGNRLVEVYTVNNEEGEKAPAIPFGSFTKKL